MNGDDRQCTDYRVLVLAPTRRDGEVTREVLGRTGLSCIVCRNVPELLTQISCGAGAVLITDRILNDPAWTMMRSCLAEQPQWSDIPIVLLTRAAGPCSSHAALVAALTNVTVLDRPTSTRTLVSSVHAAIRSRSRQYQIRDQMQALQVAEEAMRDADRRKDEFLAMLAHELRNPLAPIRTAGELLGRLLPPQSRPQAAVDIVKRQVSHLTRLVDDLLDVSRITQGRIRLRRTTLELSSIVCEAMESVEPLLREKRHRVVRAMELRPLYVNGDSARLAQCVTNLLTNAAKYTDAGGEVRVETRHEEGSAVVRVSDNGVGISAELLPKVFDLFVQSDRSLDRSQGGLGIGLSIVQRLITMHGGTVSACSPGLQQGSIFQIRLPLAAAPASDATALAPMASISRKVLIVDDNCDAAISLAEVLRLDGHFVEVAHTGSSALQCVASFQPEVVLLDIGLPDRDGYQVAHDIRARGDPVRLVALTGYGQAEDRERTRAAGFDAHLVKPVDFGALEAAVAGGAVSLRNAAPSRLEA